MNQNIFKKKNEYNKDIKYNIDKTTCSKYNPDLINKYNNIINDRDKILITYNNKNIYNPITNIIPDNIKNNKDLLLNNSDSNDKINNLLINIQIERKNQDNTIKPISSKIVNNSNTIINDFDDLKKPYINNNNNNINNNNNNNNIKELFKELGLIHNNE